MTQEPIPIEVHTKFLPLIHQPHRFANIYGGRGGMKSEMTHRIALMEAIRKPMRVCNARETMASIKDSSHKLLSDAIHEYGMAKSQNGPYEIQESRILRREGERIVSEFIFIGIRENVRDQKSLKGIDLTIVEEAAKVSQDSLDVLIPTVMGRVEGSRMWFIWNPEIVTDPVYQMFMVKEPPTGTIHINTNYLENPWLTETMRILADDCRREDIRSLSSTERLEWERDGDMVLDKYGHIWLGRARDWSTDAIFSKEIKKATDERRLGQFPINRSRPVDTCWDLGHGDKTAIWFVQSYDGWFNFVDYIEDSGRTLEHYCVQLQRRDYLYGYDWVPHDAVDAIIHRKLASSDTKSPEQVLRELGRKPRIAAKVNVSARIDAGRSFFSRCRFDEKRCEAGLRALRMYQWAPPQRHPITGEKTMNVREPLHDEFSHGSDAYQVGAVCLKQPKVQIPQGESIRHGHHAEAWMG